MTTWPYLGYRVARRLSRALPPRGAFWLAERLVEQWWRCSPTDRAAVASNLSVILGRPVPGDGLTVDVFRNFALYLTEFLSADLLLRRSSIRIEGREETAAQLRKTPQAIILSAHLGNWELGAMVLRQLGFSISVVALPHRDPRVNRLFDRQRQRCGVEVIPLGATAMQRSLAVLRQGGLVGIVGDREFGVNGIPVQFFGRQVLMPRGPALLSLRTGAPVVPIFLLRTGRERFQLSCSTPIQPSAGDARAAAGESASSSARVQRLTQHYSTAIEDAVARFPNQWLMFQPILAPERLEQAERPLATNLSKRVGGIRQLQVE
ncbi:MAG: lysophospholipid acyltransferase family protein [Candidatus Omnitrophica bacterium]|nr:lysophospholipid acyltransferase family protein [Candidatus Omnitrophota bacterium]